MTHLLLSRLGDSAYSGINVVSRSDKSANGAVVEEMGIKKRREDRYGGREDRYGVGGCWM